MNAGQNQSRPRIQKYLVVMLPHYTGILGYASVLWSPHLVKHSEILEKTQRKAVRWIAGLRVRNSVSAAMDAVDLQTLQHRRRVNDLKFLSSVVSGSYKLDLDEFLKTNPYNTRHNRVRAHCSHSMFYNSYFPRITREAVFLPMP